MVPAKVFGVARDASDETGRTLCVYFERTPTDEEVRQLHDTLRKLSNGAVSLEVGKRYVDASGDIHGPMKPSELGPGVLVDQAGWRWLLDGTPIQNQFSRLVAEHVDPQLTAVAPADEGSEYPQFGTSALLQQARALCQAIEKLPPSEHQTNLIVSAAGTAFALQELQRRGEYFWPRITAQDAKASQATSPAIDQPVLDEKAYRCAAAIMGTCPDGPQDWVLRRAIAGYLKATAAPEADNESNAGYKTGFYAICEALDIGARPYPPSQALERDILPEIRRLREKAVHP